MPDDKTLIVSTDSGRKVKIRAVFLEKDEHLLLFRNGRGYTAGIPAPLCEHRHGRIEAAAMCGLKACQTIANAMKDE